MADLLLGSVGSFGGHDQTFLGGTVGRRWWLVRPFVEDDWRLAPDLTLNLGFAWALVTPETEVENRQANYDAIGLKWYLPAGSPTLAGCATCVSSNGRVGIQFDKTALEPRIGLAWKPFGSGNTAIRAGYAIFHDSAWNQGGQGLWQNPPYYAEVDVATGLCKPFGATGCGLSNGFLFPNTPTPPASTIAVPGGYIYNAPVNPQNYTGAIQSENLNFKQGAIQQFNVNVEHQFPGNFVVTAAYAGSRSAHILVSQVNENTGQPSACPGGLNATPGYTLGCGTFPFAFPFFNIVDSNNSIGAASYNALLIKAETKSVRHGLYALLSYTLSKNDDSGMPDGLGTNPGALYWPLPGTAKLDWGLSQLNLTHSFTASVLYDLPFGKGRALGSNWSGPVNAILGNWQVDVIQKATSGFPLFVVDSSDPSGVFFYYNGLTLQRPNEVGNPLQAGQIPGNPSCAAPAQIHTHQNWFNPCAFESAPLGQLGTAPRAPVSGPRFINTDFSLIKNIPLAFREGMGLQFRAEFFNLFNHPQFYMTGLADTGMQDINTPSSFGVLNDTVNNPRLIQLALKLNF